MPGTAAPSLSSRIFARVFGKWFTGRARPFAPGAPRAVAFSGPGAGAPAVISFGDPPTGSRGWTHPPIPVSSSNLDRVAYDEPTQTLEVSFLGKGPGARASVYHYAGVPADVYLGLMNAPSKGSYLHRVVKTPPGRYPYRRVL